MLLPSANSASPFRGSDFQKLEPGNKQALNELQKIQDVSTGCVLSPDCTPRRTVKPIDKPKHLQSTKPLMQINIEEVNGKVLAPPVPVREIPDADQAPEDTSPRSTSPSAKMIKIEELPDPSPCQSEL
uniref:Uncharacterized protein n=1 Tax=Knipowitschia caucasica TaxID=637954 RepID=A0AAV2IX05_KNICA